MLSYCVVSNLETYSFSCWSEGRSKSVCFQLRINTPLTVAKGRVNIGKVIGMLRLNMILCEILLIQTRHFFFYFFAYIELNHLRLNVVMIVA